MLNDVRLRGPASVRRAALFAFVSTLASALLLLVYAAPARADEWLQFNGDPQHSGVNAQEIRISRANVARLSRLFRVTVPDYADGSPAYVPGVSTPKGRRDLLLVSVSTGQVVAVDARTGESIWSSSTPPGPRFTTSCGAVDPNRSSVYAYGLDGRIHKYAIGDGTEVTTGGWPQLATLKPDTEKCSPCLATATAGNGRRYLYTGNSSFEDTGDYQGHITAIDLGSGAQTVFNAACSDRTVHFAFGGQSPACPWIQNGIWARSAVVYSPALDRILFTTGNGTYDADSGGFEWGNSLVAIRPDGTTPSGRPLDSYTPVNHQQLTDNDLDLGSTTPGILPPLPGSALQHLAVQGGKDGFVRLLNLDNLSGLGGPGHLGGELQAVALPQGGGILTTPAIWKNPADGRVWVYYGNGRGLAAFELVLVEDDVPRLSQRWLHNQRSTSPFVANGILFTATNHSIRALDATTGEELWSTADVGNIHMQSPVVVDGVLYITDLDHQVLAFSLDGQPPGAAATFIVPSAAHAPGQTGTLFTTDVTVANTGPEEAAFALKFVEHGTDGTAALTKGFLLGPGKSATYADIVKSVFEREGTYGAVHVVSATDRLAVFAETSSPGGGGTYGQGLPAAAPSDLIGATPRSLPSVRETADFRTNLILASAAAFPVRAIVTLVGADGTSLGSKAYDLLPLGMMQVTHVVRDLGVPGDLTGARLVLVSGTDGGSFAAYASIIDNRTNDPRVILPR